MPYYYVGTDGDSFIGATVHGDRDCDEADDGVMRPLAQSTVDAAGDELWFCFECTVEGTTDETDDAEICTAELSSGGECGREKPCPYHG